ncbi:MAG: hypothetical protein ABI210_01630 [Abditibacteriaceae bacterium]
MLIAHLDFKGVLPGPSHLPQLLQDIADQGFDAVLVEYEDVFPFENYDISAAPRERWSKRTLHTFLETAARLKLEVIPLQQCLGHLEYVFRWKKFREFTLDEDYPSMIDFADKSAQQFLFGMLEQVMDAHPDARFVHVGMDEAHGLIGYARDRKLDVVELFLNHLEEICKKCEARGKTPIIWSDMLEDNFNPATLKRFETFKNRVILCTWDYATIGEKTKTARIAGSRVCRAWLGEPANPQAPPIFPTTKWIEDLSPAARKAITPFQDGREFQSPFWCDVWVQRGFRVLGASASRASEDFAVLPHYNTRITNVVTWEETARRCHAMGTVVTSWARGTTWCPPIFPFDLTWPILENAARAAGKNPLPFFGGIDKKVTARIFSALGRCREDWRIELQVAEEMEALAPQLKSHQFEWQCAALMARVLHWQRRAAAVQDEVDYFAANTRPVPAEWQRRIDEQIATRRAGKDLRQKTKAHFGARYAGEAFEEWLRDVFDAPIARLEQCGVVCATKKKQAHALWKAKLEI